MINEIREIMPLIKRHVVIGKKNVLFPVLNFISPGSLPRGILPPEKCHIRPEVMSIPPMIIRALLKLSISNRIIQRL